VAPLGRDRDTLLDALLAGKSSDGHVRDFDAARDAGRSKNLKYMSRASALAVTAARSALTEAGLVPATDAEGDDLACFLGIGMTSSEVTDLEKLVTVSRDANGISLSLLGERGLRATNPLISFKILSNMPLCHVALTTRARGANSALQSLGGETFSALADACSELREGRARAALFGGVDSQLDKAGLLQLSRRGLLADLARPFDTAASGRVLGEGAAFFVLERESDARARGARVLAVIEAIGLAPSHEVSLAAPGAEPLRRAIEGAGSACAVFASASGDPRGDAAEAEASRSLEVPVTATRGALGDALAAGPAIDLAIAIAALERGRLPAVHGLEKAAHDLDFVREPRDLALRSILVLAAGLSATVGACRIGRPT
jgi:3-oxoacyl-[acyl-carrier-protein] synthase II